MTTIPVTTDTVRAELEKLAGERAPVQREIPQRAVEVLISGAGIGFSQFNELLLLLGFDRVSQSFFGFIATGDVHYLPGQAIESFRDLQQGVERFQILGMLAYGNVKFAFKQLSREPDELRGLVELLSSRGEMALRGRHAPIHPVEPIPTSDTYLLGYIVQAEIAARLKRNPMDAEALTLEARRKAVVERGLKNHRAYLVSDHLDVYVATSMRQRHEYAAIAEFTAAVFEEPEIRDLGLRWFDPTQAYCLNRIDKGLAEALMLKRAKCTLYLTQESDTLGKDSELASTLAQGKPVIAYVPRVSVRADVEALLERLVEAYPGKSRRQLILEQLKIFAPDLAWSDTTVQEWIANGDRFDEPEAIELWLTHMARHYDKRAKTLREDHPLGIQVNLRTGVANGVLVVRSSRDCARLIHRIVTGSLEFDLESTNSDGSEYLMLREKISQSIFRVMTTDPLLANSFWNFYLKEPDE